MREPIIRISLATIIGGFIALSIHIILLNHLVTPVVNKANKTLHIHIAQAPYNILITSFAYAAFLLPDFGVVILYYLIGDNLPAKTKLGKGIFVSIITYAN